MAVLFAGLLAIIAAIIIALSHAMAWWLATLLFALVIIGIASFLAWRGLSHLEERATPGPDALPVREGAGA
jgi:membrane protein implicated in regulation of membrane protease activity